MLETRSERKFYTDAGLEFVGNPWERLCVIWTLESMMSRMEGRRIVIGEEGREIRRRQLSRGNELLEDKRKSIKVIARFDQWQMTDLIKKIGCKDSEVGRILRNSFIGETHGGWSDVKKLVGEGYQVGIRVYTLQGNGMGSHMFHVGVGERGEMLNYSDYTQAAMVAEPEIVEGYSAQYFEAITQESRGWNILVMKKK